MTISIFVWDKLSCYSRLKSIKIFVSSELWQKLPFYFKTAFILRYHFCLNFQWWFFKNYLSVNLLVLIKNNYCPKNEERFLQWNFKLFSFSFNYFIQKFISERFSNTFLVISINTKVEACAKQYLRVLLVRNISILQPLKVLLNFPLGPML